MARKRRRLAPELHRAGDLDGHHNAVGVFATDLDGDGDTDVLSAGYDDNTITWYGNAAPCGDGLLHPDETCDDGYTDACGSCNADCSGAGTGSTCGDGTLCPETEECDDTNPDGGDGCSATCAVEEGWDCTGAPSTCTEVCGDGLIVGSEECDDENTDGGDGCSATCTVEPGSKCAGEPSVCITSIPAVSEWGMVAMTLLILTAGTLVCMRRRRAGQAPA